LARNIRHRIGIDLGGTRAKIGEVHDGKLVWTHVSPSAVGDGPEAVVKRLAETVRAASKDYETVSGIGLGVPGLIRDGILVGSYNFPEWFNVPLRDLMQEAFERPVAVAMDVEAIAAGEWQAGGHAGKHRIFLFTIGTGIGAAAIINGTVIGGAGGFLLVPKGSAERHLAQCELLEHLIAGPGIVKRAHARVERGDAPGLADLAKNGALTVETLADAARDGDDAAHAVWRETGELLGWAAVNVAHLFLLDRIVIGGGIRAAGNLLLDPALAFFQIHATPAVRDSCDIVVSALGEDAGVLGAATLVAE
jgi:glucokinase